MAVFTAIDDAGIFFNSVLYTGTGTTHTITGVGFQPDFVWGKCRSQAQSHRAIDAVRGGDKVLYPDLSNVEGTDSELITSFNSDGYVMGTSGTNANDNTETYVSWNWKAGTTSGIATNVSTDITPSAYSFNQTSRFSVIKYSGNSGVSATVAHGLGVTPAMFAVKNLGNTDSWEIYHQNSNAVPEDYLLQFNTNGGAIDNSDFWADTAPDSVNITLGIDDGINGSYDYVAYCFADVQGFSKFGGYTGNGDADGAFVYTGFRPAYVCVKKTSDTGDWYTYDNKREGYNTDNNALYIDLTNAESTSEDIDILSNGFKLRGTNAEINGDGGTYIYMAFAESPFVNSEGVPTNAR